MYFWFLVVLVQVDREKEMAYIIRLGHKVRACVYLCVSVSVSPSVLSMSVSRFLSVCFICVSVWICLVGLNNY